MRLLGPLVTVSAVVLLAGCTGGDEPSEGEGAGQEPEMSQVEKDWRADLEEELGFDGFDFNAAVGQATADCRRKGVDAWKGGIALTGSLDAVGTTRIGLEHTCPKSLKAFDAAVKELKSVDDLATYVCTLPADALTPDEQLKMQMLCAG